MLLSSCGLCDHNFPEPPFSPSPPNPPPVPPVPPFPPPSPPVPSLPPSPPAVPSSPLPPAYPPPPAPPPPSPPPIPPSPTIPPPTPPLPSSPPPSPSSPPPPPSVPPPPPQPPDCSALCTRYVNGASASDPTACVRINDEGYDRHDGKRHCYPYHDGRCPADDMLPCIGGSQHYSSYPDVERPPVDCFDGWGHLRCGKKFSKNKCFRRNGKPKSKMIKQCALTCGFCSMREGR